MKKLLFYSLLFISFAVNSQTLDDFPWLSQMIDPASCCEVNTATAYWNQGL